MLNAKFFCIYYFWFNLRLPWSNFFFCKDVIHRQILVSKSCKRMYHLRYLRHVHLADWFSNVFWHSLMRLSWFSACLLWKLVFNLPGPRSFLARILIIYQLPLELFLCVWKLGCDPPSLCSCILVCTECLTSLTTYHQYSFLFLYRF